LNTALEKIKRSALSNEISILLLKTKKANKVSETQGINAFSDSCWLGKEAATLLVKKGFKTVGVDAFSLDAPASKKLPIHKLLLSNFINIVECLDLRAVKEGLYYFLCLPLKIEACDGAPARALLIVEA
ncbi:MAG: cyclase family protein, partial [Methanosarcinaceae archaeon]|nr:cyclase family protein [Methanosarcinaceae archaeon]